MGELLNLVGLSMGVVLYAMLLAMVLRSPGMSIAHESGDRLPLATAILGLAWNACALPIYELQHIGIRGPVASLSAVGFSALGFLPAVVVHSVLRSGTDGARAAAKRILTPSRIRRATLAAIVHLHSLVNGGPVPAVLYAPR